MDRDALMERMAKAIIAAGYNPATARDIARAALAVAEEAVAEDLEASAEHYRSEGVKAYFAETAQHCDAIATALEEEAAAIRARATAKEPRDD